MEPTKYDHKIKQPKVEADCYQDVVKRTYNTTEYIPAEESTDLIQVFNL